MVAQPAAGQDCEIGSDDWDDIQRFRRCLDEGGLRSWDPWILHEAALRTNNPTIVYLLLEAGADPNARNDEGLTALHAGVQNQNPVVTSHLLEAGANPRTRDNEGYTPLHYVARSSGNPRVIGALLDAGADPLAEANDGRTPLHSALSYGATPGVVTALIEAGTADLLTPLQLATVRGDVTGVAALLAEGADPNATDPYGWSSLHFAVPTGVWGIVAELLQAGADPNLRTAGGATPLHLAARHADATMVATLVERGADVHVRDSADGNTPLDNAVLYGTNPMPVVMVLLEAGADPGSAAEQGDRDGHGPLHHATMESDVTVALLEALLEAGADPNTPDRSGNMPLHYVVGNTGEAAVIEALLAAGADPNAQGRSGNTPLHYAAGNAGSAAVIEVLLAAGADVTASNNRGDAPMDLAGAVGGGSAYWRLVVPGGELTAGRSVNSRLSSVDNVARDGSYQEIWTYNARAGQRLVVTMLSGDMDAYLRVVQRAGNVIARDDDGAGGTDARVEFAAPDSGEYLIVATTFGRDETGSYQIRVHEPGSSATSAAPVGEPFRDCEGCPLMVTVPAGTFIMGSPASEEGRDDDEGPRRYVTIETQFAVGVYEVTFDEWEACRRAMGCPGDRPEDEDWGRGRRPVINVSWNDAQVYVRWLSRQTGQRYRLLSEAEWEYVARAGTETARYWGESASGQCRYANGGGDRVSCTDGHEYTAPVGSFAPNAFGLYDVLGNVYEWTQDCHNASYAGAPTDSNAWESGDCSGRGRVLRGGSWFYSPGSLRSANRFGRSTVDRYWSYGFRVARTLN